MILARDTRRLTGTVVTGRLDHPRGLHPIVVS